MLRTTQWLLRTVAVVVIGVESLAFGPDRTAAADAATATALAVSCIGLALWALLEARGELRARGGAVLTLLLTIIAVTAGTVSTQRGSSMIGVVLVAVVAAGTQTELATSWYIASAAGVAIAAGALATDADTGTVLGYLLIVLVSLLAGHQRRSYRVQAEQSALLLQQVEQLRAEQRRVAVLDERARIAREIHDVLAHSLGALGIQIQAARALLEDHDCGDGDGDGDGHGHGHARGHAGVERADEVLAVAQRMAGDGLTETRRAVNALRTDTAPLDQQLAAMAREHRRLHHSVVRLRIEGDADADAAPLQSEQTLAVARVAQESLTNAAKHAPHQEIQIVVRYEADAVTLTVANTLAPDGADTPADGFASGGFATAGFATVNGGYGLTGMRERLLLLGGTLTAGIDDGRWTVVAKVPR